MSIYTVIFFAGLIITGIGFLTLVAASVSFRWRALRNKPAWEGHTRPLIRWGLPILIIGLIFFIPALLHLYNTAS